jgi:deoxyadenosine/deoxycytidine kinase
VDLAELESQVEATYGMSAKLRSRLRKRGRGVDECDDVHNRVYFNKTSDLLGKDVGEECPNIEIPIQQYKHIVRNDNEVIDRISTDVRNLREN